MTFSAPFVHTSTSPSPVRRLLPLHVCPRCLTAFTCQDWITSLFCYRIHSHSHSHPSHLKSACKMSPHTKLRLLLFMHEQPATPQARINQSHQFLLWDTRTISTPFYANSHRNFSGSTNAFCAFLFVIPPHLKNCADSQLHKLQFNSNFFWDAVFTQQNNRYIMLFFEVCCCATAAFQRTLQGGHTEEERGDWKHQRPTHFCKGATKIKVDKWQYVVLNYVLNRAVHEIFTTMNL